MVTNREVGLPFNPREVTQAPDVRGRWSEDLGIGRRVSYYRYNDKMVEALVWALGMSIDHPHTWNNLNKLLNLGFDSSDWWRLTSDQGETAILLSCKFIASSVLSEGRVQNRTTFHRQLPDQRSRSIMLEVGNTHIQSSQEISRSTAEILIDPHPFPLKEGKREPLPEENKWEGFLQASPYHPTQERVLLFAQLTGDHNPAHLDPAYVGRTRFGMNTTIAHGVLVGSAAVVRAAEVLREQGVRGRLQIVDLCFLGPVKVGENTVTPLVEKPEAHMGKSKSFDLVVINEQEKKVIQGRLALVDIRC